MVQGHVAHLSGEVEQVFEPFHRPCPHCGLGVRANEGRLLESCMVVACFGVATLCGLLDTGAAEVA